MYSIKSWLLFEALASPRSKYFLFLLHSHSTVVGFCFVLFGPQCRHHSFASPTAAFRQIRTQCGAEPPHDRVGHLAAVHACVVVAFVVLVLLREEPARLVVRRHGGFGRGLRAARVGRRHGYGCSCSCSSSFGFLLLRELGERKREIGRIRQGRLGRQRSSRLFEGRGVTFRVSQFV